MRTGPKLEDYPPTKAGYAKWYAAVIDWPGTTPWGDDDGIPFPPKPEPSVPIIKRKGD